MALPEPSAWLSDQAFGLQAEELNSNIGVFASTPDPQKAKRWFGCMCVMRASPMILSFLEDDLTKHRNRPGWTPVVSWLTATKFNVLRAPQDYPFCLNEREFAFYANKFFGGEMKDIEDIYKPPNFYWAFGSSAFIKFAGAGVAAALPALVPAWAVGGGFIAEALPSLAAAGAIDALSQAFPDTGFEAEFKRRVWPRYLADLRRRRLQ